VHVTTCTAAILSTDGRELKLTRYTRPEPKFHLLLERMRLESAKFG
jgi:hypothetical protein